MFHKKYGFAVWATQEGNLEISLGAKTQKKKKKKNEKRNTAPRIVKFTVSLNSRLNQFSFTLSVTDVCHVMHMSKGALR